MTLNEQLKALGFGFQGTNWNYLRARKEALAEAKANDLNTIEELVAAYAATDSTSEVQVSATAAPVEVTAPPVVPSVGGAEVFAPVGIPPVSATTTATPQNSGKATTAKPVKTVAEHPYVAQWAVRDANLKFVYDAIRYLAKSNPTGGKGVHSVFSGFNRLLMTKFRASQDQIIAMLNAYCGNVTKDGIAQLYKRPAKRGFTYYIPGTQPSETAKRTEADIDAIIRNIG